MCEHKNLKHHNEYDRVVCLDCGKTWKQETHDITQPIPFYPTNPEIPYNPNTPWYPTYPTITYTDQ